MRTYSIAGEPVHVAKGTLSLSDRMNQRTQCSFVIVDPPFDIEPGMDVLIQDGEEVIFAGQAEIPTTQGDQVLEVAVRCVDYSRLLDKRLVADTFESTRAGDIVRQFIADVFAEEGISEGDIADGPVIAQAVFNYPDGSTALNWIRDVAQLNWSVDQLKRLHLYDRAACVAPFALTDTSANYHNLRVTRNRSQYRNRQYVRGGRDRSLPVELEKPTPKPDGVSRTFVTRLPLAEKPRVFIDSVEVLPEQVGVIGLDTGRQWYFAFASNTVHQDPSLDPLDTEVLEITYRGLYPVMVVAEDPAEIAARQVIEGGTGVYERVDRDENLQSRDAALQFGKGLLVRYGEIPRTVEFETHVPGLRAGHLLSIHNTLHRLDGTFLVESVTARDDRGVMRYEVKALDGEALGGWEEVFRSLVRGQQRLVIRENEILVIQLTLASQLGLGSQTTIFAHDYLVAGQHVRAGVWRI